MTDKLDLAPNERKPITVTDWEDLVYDLRRMVRIFGLPNVMDAIEVIKRNSEAK